MDCVMVCPTLANYDKEIGEMKMITLTSNKLKKCISFVCKFLFFISSTDSPVSNTTEDLNLDNRGWLTYNRGFNTTNTGHITFTWGSVAEQQYQFWNFRPGIYWFTGLCKQEKEKESYVDKLQLSLQQHEQQAQTVTHH